MVIWRVFFIFMNITNSRNKNMFQWESSNYSIRERNVLKCISFRSLSWDTPNIYIYIYKKEYTYTGKMLLSHWLLHKSFSLTSCSIHRINSDRTPDRQRLIYRRWSNNNGWLIYELEVKKLTSKMTTQDTSFYWNCN